MTEKGSSTNQNVHLIQIVRFIVCGFQTKGTFPQNDMGVILFGIGRGNPMILAILKNILGCHIQRLVVTADKDG
jgi:hypothetical protein